MNAPGSAMGTASLFVPFGNVGMQARVRLYTFAHAGASARVFASWTALLPEVEVVGVEFAGHGARTLEEPETDVRAMAREAVAGIVQGNDSRPFAFYGHSLGALIAYEAARLLMKDAVGTKVKLGHLFVGAMRAPHLPRTTNSIAHLETDDFLSAIQQRFGGIPQAVLNEPELLAMILPAMRADFVAYEDYAYEAGPMLDCPMTAFAGVRDPIVPEASVAAWRDHTSGPFEFHTMAGDHFFLAERRAEVVRILSGSMLCLPTLSNR